MKPKLTPWFQGSVKPDIPGFYEREWSAEGEGIPQEDYLNDYFDGQCWTLWFHNKELNSMQIKCNRNLRWRGLAEDPAKDAP